MSMSLAPRYDPAGPIAFYGAAWHQETLPALLSVFSHLDASQLADNIKVAIAACRLSRTHPQRKLFSSAACRFRPDAGHESVSHGHYSAAIATVVKWQPEELRANPASSLAVLVLFCYLEASMGNFGEFRVHSQAVRRLTESWSPSLLRSCSGLLDAWIEVELQNWWRRAYFCTPCFYQRSALPAVEWPKSSRAEILLILCESHRLRSAAMLGRPSDDLEQYDRRLDGWHAALSDLPMESDGALVFASHAAAMNFAYYVTARVVCTDADVDSWIDVLRRIATGISWKDCLQFNVYSVGFAGLLLACLLHSRQPSTGQWMQAWLEERIDDETFEEGNFPVAQVLQAIRLITRERGSGNNVRALFQSVDDGGGSGKLGSYQSQAITCLTACAETDGSLRLYEIAL